MPSTTSSSQNSSEAAETFETGPAETVQRHLEKPGMGRRAGPEKQPQMGRNERARTATEDVIMARKDDSRGWVRHAALSDHVLSEKSSSCPTGRRQADDDDPSSTS